MLASLTSIPWYRRRWFDDHRPILPENSNARTWLMWLFLASLTAIFAPLIVIQLILRGDAGGWPPPGLVVPLPGFLFSTALLVAISAVLHYAIRAAAADARSRLRILVYLALVMAIGFVGSQIANWREVLESASTETTWRYIAYLYIFTAIHALHVIGGVVPLTVTAMRATQERYSSRRQSGIRLCAMYWHYLDAVWLVMLITIFLEY